MSWLVSARACFGAAGLRPCTAVRGGRSLQGEPPDTGGGSSLCWRPASAVTTESRKPPPRWGRRLREQALLRLDLLRAARELPTRPDEVAGVPVGVLLEVVLVLRLCLPERPGRGDLGDHLARP